MRTIRVTGTASASAPPDRIALSLALVARDPDYRIAADLADRQFADLRAAVESAGVAPDDLRTGAFRVSTEYTHETTDGHTHRHFAGYLIHHDLTLTLPMDLDLLAATLDAIHRSPSHPELSIQFRVNDPEPLRDRVLADATRQAERRARVIADAAGVRLGQLHTVSYDWADHRPVSSTSIEATALRSSFRDITPEAVTIQETVRFEWDIVS